MEKSWQDVATQQAELISSRLRELLSSGLDLLRSEFGVDLGLKPELYPSWVFLATAIVGLLLAVFSWVAACNGLFGGKKRPATASEESSDSTKDPVTKTVKTEEQKKKHKKKPAEKQKTEPNGRPLPELPEEETVTDETPKPSPEIKTEKGKKNKKKSKTEVKQGHIASSDGKEPEDGTWETKVSNREKRQQRRKDKVPGDGSGSPGGVDPAIRAPVEQFTVTVAAPVSLRRNRGEPSRAKPAKGEAIASPANWSEPPVVNGGGWTDMAVKIPAQMSALDGEKWPHILKETPHAWGQETEGSWSGLDGRLKTDLNPVSLPVIGLNTTANEFCEFWHSFIIA
ncbi:hypothetical protein AAFF_G00175130 [Aldrovandia affinis]|uniref:LYRIC n=1 Tax=Aldrovandia affinis TaxID=143900 RepID=A0AAD7RLU5_9TELE|nr:hypothetical protein AAFF_G00175130 [Aldrovandia affinis]